MKRLIPIKTLFLDIGGVLLSDGWDHNARRRGSVTFNLDFDEIEARHRVVFEPYEDGKITLDEYLDLVIFYKKRRFTRARFKKFMYSQSEPCLDMISLAVELKVTYGLKIAVVSNEAREMNAYRIRQFKLNEFVDFFISSCFVHMRKPDPEIFRLALDIAQTSPAQVLYIENTAMFVQIAESLGIRSIHHTDFKSTVAKLAAFGLQNLERNLHGTD